MYEGWPEEASVTHFLGKPTRPTRVTVGAVALLVAAALNLVITGMYTTAGENAAGNWLLNPVDGMTATPPLVFGAVTVVWLGLLAFFVWRGTPWALRPARWTGLAGVVACGGLGMVAMPGISTPTGSEGALLLYAIMSLLTTVAYGVAGGALLGRSSADFFRRRPAEGETRPVPRQYAPEGGGVAPAPAESPRFEAPLFEPPKFGDLGGPQGQQPGQQPGAPGQPPQGGPYGQQPPGR